MAGLENMKLFGLDYYRVIYVSVTLLIILMAIIYVTAEDETLKKVTLIQGSMSAVLVVSLAWFHGQVEQKKLVRV